MENYSNIQKEKKEDDDEEKQDEENAEGEEGEEKKRVYKRIIKVKIIKEILLVLGLKNQ